ncbi:UV radiation resistance protein and autophagy-related subunit 14-domain-containing protein [Lasiosphaeria ovina]|uniref:Autophagy-related protein 14 n=1 Tax=Lasiosphaeria ovina TaxID=92902 RepID=A0AAE0TXW6_9PEZI|nr:UV radiation resistance protein and autophagy-related subunit 14-domain-containing protein [Lasiosphaeria ovina]
MNCSVCHRPHNANKLPFLCAVDARNHVYECRVELAQALIQNEEAEQQVNAAILASESNEANGSDASLPRARLDWLKSEEEASADRTSQIIAQADRLKAEIDAARSEIEAKKESTALRKSDLEAVSTGIAARRSRQLEEAERAIHRTKYKWNRSADTMAATRAFLCDEAARLYGLRQVKKGSAKRYEIGGVEIVELHAMNNVAPEVISTSLAHIAHILVLASHYLAIRLPSEITLPHREYPRPTIFSLASSYRHGEIPFPGSALSSQIPSGATRDAEPKQHVPRPRPLFIDRPLAILAKEDPSAYSLFLEGVSLLAYDIAWACCSQGVSFGDKDSYEDMCNMGQNLWRLLIGDQLHRRSVEPAFPSSLTPPVGSPVKDGDLVEATKPKSMIGRWSHGTAHTFLGGADGTEFIRNFKILSPLKLVDRLKKRLSSEAPMLEWEKIEGDELEDGFEDGVFVRGHGRSGSGSRATDLVGAASVMTIRTFGTSAGISENGASTAKGTSGWTKLKNR